MSDRFSSSDDDLEEVLKLASVPKTRMYFENIVPQFDDNQFCSHFRLSQEITEQLANRFAGTQYYHRQEGNSEKVTPLKYMIVFLWFASNEAASFRDVSDRFNVSKSTLFKIIRRVIYFISNLSPEIIKWPTGEEQNEIERHFRENSFPVAIGIIDGTHIRIDKPKDDPDSYLNRKHFYSIQAQIVCDHRKKVRDILMGYPGSVHDSRVFRTSPLAERLPEICNGMFIIGNSGYPCTRYLLTPFKDNGHLTRHQRNYNYLLSKNRYSIEYCFGIIKQKFRQLYHIKLKNIDDIVHFIRCCAVLHNLAIDNVFNEDPEVAVDEREVVLNEDDEPERDDRNGLGFRNEVMNNLRLVI